MRTKFTLSLFAKIFRTIGFGMVLLACSFLITGAGSSALKEVETLGISDQKKEFHGRMFLITVTDSNDDTIGTRCEKDREEITLSFEEFADWLGMEMAEPKVISGDGFSKAAVNEAIDSWLSEQEPGSADVVVFYYSGHGFRYPDDASEYPRMWLKTSEDRNTETTNLRLEEDVFDRIVTMGAGVNLVISDCCNTSVAGDNAQFEEASVPVRKRNTRKRSAAQGEESDLGLENAEKLFIPNPPLSIIATAAGKGEFAGGKVETGGFFTNYLLEALNECIFEARVKPDWESIFSYANKNASYWAKSGACPQAKHNSQGRCIQNARYKIIKAE